jgi:hypothetical protein
VSGCTICKQHEGATGTLYPPVRAAARLGAHLQRASKCYSGHLLHLPCSFSLGGLSLPARPLCTLPSAGQSRPAQTCSKCCCARERDPECDEIAVSNSQQWYARPYLKTRGTVRVAVKFRYEPNDSITVPGRRETQHHNSKRPPSAFFASLQSGALCPIRVRSSPSLGPLLSWGQFMHLIDLSQ